jgi:hypothetical protein
MNPYNIIDVYREYAVFVKTGILAYISSLNGLAESEVARSAEFIQCIHVAFANKFLFLPL